MPAPWTSHSEAATAIYEKYRNRMHFMEPLNGLEGRSIVQSEQTRRK